jgi:hypothetical protein
MRHRLSRLASALAAATARGLTSSRVSLRKVFAIETRSYRPEKYYMRGPGPKWRDKHGAAASHR